MREILTDWGVDEAYFRQLYKNVQKSYGHGVSLTGNCIHFDNQFAKGKVEFFQLSNNISVLKLRLSFTESVMFRRVLHEQPDYYCCLFSLKEGIDLHAFDTVDRAEMNRLGLSAERSMLYFSADVQTLFRLLPNGQTRAAIVIFKRGAFSDTLESTDRSRDLVYLGGDSVKGYAAMNREMIERVTNFLDYEGSESLRLMHILGAIYQLLAATYRQIENERELSAQTTGVMEVARMVQIRNLLVADFSRDYPRLEEMAKKAQISETKFKALFKKLFKLSYHQYYQHHRLMAARQSIVLGKSVSETAYEFGFNSVSNFSVAFKKMFRMSPSEIEPHQNDSTALAI